MKSSYIQKCSILFGLIFFWILMMKGQGISIGSALLYGSEINSIGIQGRSYLFLSESVCFGPEFNYFLPRKVEIDGDEVQRYMIETNFNIHYVFHLPKKIGIYPLTGVNFTYEWKKDEPEVEYGFAANLGGGLHYFAGRWMPFVEYLYTFSEKPQQTVLFGFFFVFLDKKMRNNKKE